MKNRFILSFCALTVMSMMACLTSDPNSPIENCLSHVQWYDHGDSIELELTTPYFTNKCTTGPITVISDTSSCQMILHVCRKLILINLKSDQVFEYDIPEKLSIKRQGAVEFRDSSIWYSSINEVYLFNQFLEPVYNSNRFIESLPDSVLLGASGVQITTHLEEENETVLKYEILTDVIPIVKAVYLDTVLFK